MIETTDVVESNHPLIALTNGGGLRRYGFVPRSASLHLKRSGDLRVEALESFAPAPVSGELTLLMAHAS